VKCIYRVINLDLTILCCYRLLQFVYYRGFTAQVEPMIACNFKRCTEKFEQCSVPTKFENDMVSSIWELLDKAPPVSTNSSSRGMSDMGGQPALLSPSQLPLPSRNQDLVASVRSFRRNLRVGLPIHLDSHHWESDIKSREWEILQSTTFLYTGNVGKIHFRWTGPARQSPISCPSANLISR